MKVIIIDDHPIVRRGLVNLLSLEDDLTFSGEAVSVKESLRLIDRVDPDIALVDLRLGNEWGLDVIEKAKETNSVCKFVLLTSSISKEEFNLAKKAEVDGFINKSALPEELLYAIRLIVKGRKYYDPAILEMMMDTNQKDVGKLQTIEQLTPKEAEVLKILGKGYTNRQIANELFVSEYTVKKHVSQILAKLGLQDRTNAALYANEMGMFK